MPRCRTQIYLASPYPLSVTKLFNQNLHHSVKGILQLGMASNAMYFLHVQDELAVSTDSTIANVGGLLGMFLGVSFLSIIAGLQVFLARLQGLYLKYKSLSDTS